MDLALIVRGLAAYQVLLWHTSGAGLHHGVWAVINVSGTQCVWLFLAISGYLVSLGFETGRYDLRRRRDVVAFAIARLLRIVPLYALVAVLTYLALRDQPVAPGVPGYTRRLWTTLLFVSPQTALPSQFWTLILEIRFYLVLPLVLFVHRRLGAGTALKFAAYVALAMVPGVRLGLGIGGIDDRTFVGNASHFVAGMLVHDAWRWLRDRQYFQRPGAVRTIALGVFAALVIPTWLYHTQQGMFWPVGSVLTDVAAVGILLVHRALEDRSEQAGAVAWLLSQLGVVAYGVYVWHSALLTVRPDLVHHAVLVSVATFALSALSFRFYEMPALALRQRLINRQYLGVPGKPRLAQGTPS